MSRISVVRIYGLASSHNKGLFNVICGRIVVLHNDLPDSVRPQIINTKHCALSSVYCGLTPTCMNCNNNSKNRTGIFARQVLRSAPAPSLKLEMDRNTWLLLMKNRRVYLINRQSCFYTRQTIFKHACDIIYTRNIYLL